MMLFLLLLLLPSQLAYHFWPSWSLVHGIRVDYLSPTLYLTDLIILALFLISRFRIRVPLPHIAFATLNILISYSPNIAIYNWLRLLEFYWLFKYLISHNSFFNAPLAAPSTGWESVVSILVLPASLLSPSPACSCFAPTPLSPTPTPSPVFS